MLVAAVWAFTKGLPMKQKSDLKMKHTDPMFWLFACAYVLAICGGLSIVMNLLEWAFAGEEFSWDGVYIFCFGIFTLLMARRERRKQLTEQAAKP